MQDALSVTHEEGVVVMTLPQRMDISNTRAVVEPVQREIIAGRLHFLLDFSNTQSIDSTALGAIVQIFKSLNNQGGALVLSAVGDAVARVLSITRLDSVFTIVADRRLALEQLKRR